MFQALYLIRNTDLLQNGVWSLVYGQVFDFKLENIDSLENIDISVSLEARSTGFLFIDKNHIE